MYFSCIALGYIYIDLDIFKVYALSFKCIFSDLKAWIPYKLLNSFRQYKQDLDLSLCLKQSAEQYWSIMFAKKKSQDTLYIFITKTPLYSTFLSCLSKCFSFSHTVVDCYAWSDTTCRRCSDSYRHALIWWERMLWQRLVLLDSAHICFLTIPSVPDKPAGNKDEMAIHSGIWAASAHKNDW